MTSIGSLFMLTDSSLFESNEPSQTNTCDSETFLVILPP